MINFVRLQRRLDDLLSKYRITFGEIFGSSNFPLCAAASHSLLASNFSELEKLSDKISSITKVPHVFKSTFNYIVDKVIAIALYVLGCSFLALDSGSN